MRTAKFNVCCTATYYSELQIPDTIPKGKELEYIREHLGECTVYDLEWLADLNPEDAVTQDDIKDIYEEDNT